MQTEAEMVSEFHRHIGAPIATNPRLIPSDKATATLLAQKLRQLTDEIKPLVYSDDCLTQRVLMSLEETSEWLEAHAQENLEAAMDAWGDRCYLLLGDAVSSGFAVDKIFTEIHTSNMTKRGLDPQTGKALKNHEYQRPNLS